MFVLGLLDGKFESKKHYWPFIHKCLACDLDYRYIGKVETREDDLRYLYQRTGIVEEEEIHENQSPRELDTATLAKLYFSFVSVEELEAVKKRYRLKELADYNNVSATETPLGPRRSCRRPQTL